MNKDKHINKSIGSAIDIIAQNGIDINVTIPVKTYLLAGLTTTITTILIILAVKFIKK